MSSIYREFLFILIFFGRNPVQIFLANFCICYFFFLVHYSLILKIASSILKILLLFPMSSNDRYYTKKLYTTSLDSLFEHRDKNFSCSEYLFSYCINSFPLSFFEIISCILIYHSFPEDVILLLFSLLHHNFLILLQSILYPVNDFIFSDKFT